MSATLRVLKVELEGTTASFRYPFFVLGRQPTYEMPPPATIYGHVCSAAGGLLDPGDLTFAYWFTHEGRGVDLEHVHMVAGARGRMMPTGGHEAVQRVTAGGVEPLRREFFYRPRLTLYLSDVSLEESFRTPRYPVVLGRSQDLASYVRVETINLERAPRAYYENTLLPVTLQTAVMRGIGVTMPRYLDAERRRAPEFDQYIMLTQRLWPDESAGLADAEGHWVDPETQEMEGVHRGVAFLHFAGEVSG